MRGWALLFVLLATGCRQKVTPDAAAGFGPKVIRLDGTYGVARGGIVEPVLKVELTPAGYTFEERPHDEWKTDPEIPHTATEQEVKHGLRVASLGVPVFGLATGQMLLLKLPAGWTSGSGPEGLSADAQKGQAVTTKSGYLIVSGDQMVAAEKIQLGKR